MLARFRIGGEQRVAPHIDVGRKGEQIALRWLKSHRYRLLGKNVITSGGEADLVMLAPDRRTIVLVEVKSRVGGTIDPQSALTRDKRARLGRTLEALRRKHRWESRPARIDLLTVWWTDPHAQPDVRHFMNAVSIDRR